MRGVRRLGLLGLLVAAAPLAAQEEGSIARVTLSEAVDIALENNPALRQSRSNVDLAEADQLNAYGSFLPTLSSNYGFSQSGSGVLDQTGQTFTRTSYTFRLRASYDIFDGLRRMSQLRASRRNLTAEEATYRQRRYETMLNVKTAYYNAVANRELVRVERDRVRRQEDQLEFVRQQLDLGRATRSDRLRSQVDLNDAKLALLNAEADARASRFALAQAMGIDQQVEPVTEATLEVGPLPYQRDELLQIAVESGPSVASARAAAEAADASVSSARSTYLPNLSFSGGWDWRNDQLSLGDFQRNWSFSIQGSYPLFNGFQRETQLSQARARARSADASERQAELAVRSDLDAAYSQIETARAGIELAEQSVELSREDLRVTQQRYRLGVATILDLQSAQITLRQAEVDLVRRRFDYQIGLAQLEALLGRELEQGVAGADASENR